MDENDKRNEIAATLFSVLFGLALLLLLGWLFGRGCSSPGDEPPVAGEVGSATPSYVALPETDDQSVPDPETNINPVVGDAAQTERRLELAADKRSLEQELADLKMRHKEDYDRVAGERDALKLNTDKKIEEFEGAMVSLKSKVDQLEGSLDTASRAKSELQKKLDAAIKVQKDLEAKTKAQGDLASKLAGITREKVDLTGKLTGITKEKSDLAKKLAAATATSVAAKTAMGVGKTDLQKSEANNAKFKKQIADLESKIDGLGKEKISSAKIITQLKADAAATAKKMTAKNSESDEIIKKLTAGNKSQADEIAKLKAAAGKTVDMTAQIKKLNAEIATLKEAAAKKMDTSGISAEIERLKAAAKKMGDDASTRIKSLTREKEELADQVAKLKSAQKKRVVTENP